MVYTPREFPRIGRGVSRFVTEEYRNIAQNLKRFANGVLSLRDSNDSHDLTIELGSDLTDSRTLTLEVPDADTSFEITGDTVIEGTNTGDQTITLTGDVTGSGTGSFTATIANNAATNAKLADVATETIKGRITASTGDPEDLTGTQATTLLDVFTSALKGLAPASGGGTENFLRADGSWASATPADGSITFAKRDELFKVLTADAAASNVNTVQPWFPSAGAVTVAADTSYFVEGLLHLETGTTSYSVGLSLGGTATVGSADYCVIAGRPATLNERDSSADITLVSGTANATVTAASGDASTVIRVAGTVRISAGGGGTLIPNFTFSAAPGGTNNVKRNSFFRLTPIGNASVGSQGAWA
jgi:hypothetical protein